ncbi:hypothetical protein HNQ60_004981 [Povalibacter uvarum]|uniref:Ice-binding protein C-terminal domain-containing protein n=1 Tax=Povalibacter uvarum TaxID=732238 RepID=A0A841HV78_9GAMM|nr:PEP-CTERM sorting domain-containing protein [Povalibacter uvarum]MBB6096090.1 hypothetical protein [Povalibacter uvarum]
MPKICAIALTLICLVATVADTPGVSLFGGPAITTGEPPAATAPLEVVELPNILLASDSTIAHPVDRATWAPLSLNAADAFEQEETQTEVLGSGSVGGANYDHPTLLFRIGTSMRAGTSNTSGGGSRPGPSGTSGGAGGGAQEEPSKGDNSSAAPTDPTTGGDEAGSGPTVPNDNPVPSGPSDNTGPTDSDSSSGSNETPPTEGTAPPSSDHQPDAGNPTPEGPGDAAPPVTEAPPSHTETPPGDSTPPDHGDPSPPANEPSAPEEPPHEEPNDTPTYPSYPIDDVPGHGTPIQVPEPSSLGLLGIGLAGLLARRRRRAN